MLIRYKKTFEKIAMGLLSFMPNEKDIKKLQNTIKLYETDESWQLFLWKEEDDIIGLLGLCQLDDQIYEIEHLSVNPSYRNQGIGKSMIQAIKDLYPNARVIPGKEIETYYYKVNE